MQRGLDVSCTGRIECDACTCSEGSHLFDEGRCGGLAASCPPVARLSSGVSLLASLASPRTGRAARERLRRAWFFASIVRLCRPSSPLAAEAGRRAGMRGSSIVGTTERMPANARMRGWNLSPRPEVRSAPRETPTVPRGRSAFGSRRVRRRTNSPPQPHVLASSPERPTMQANCRRHRVFGGFSRRAPGSLNGPAGCFGRASAGGQPGARAGSTPPKRRSRVANVAIARWKSSTEKSGQRMSVTCSSA